MQVTLKMLNFICVSLFAVMQLVEGFDIPAVTVEAVKPEGLRVSIPADDKDVKFFEFHANVNKVIEEKEPGDIFNRVSAPYENKWQFTDKTVSLKKNDVLNYWVLVWKNGESYTKHGLSRKIEGTASDLLIAALSKIPGAPLDDYTPDLQNAVKIYMHVSGFKN